MILLSILGVKHLFPFLYPSIFILTLTLNIPKLSCFVTVSRILHSPSTVKTQTIVNTPDQSTFSSTPGPCPHYITFSKLQSLFYHSTLFPAFLYAESFLRALPPEVSQNPFLMFTVNRDTLSPSKPILPTLKIQ